MKALFRGYRVADSIEASMLDFATDTKPNSGLGCQATATAPYRILRILIQTEAEEEIAECPIHLAKLETRKVTLPGWL
jgi:hypothetical protein